MINDNFLKNKVSNLTGFVTNTATEIKSVVKKNAGKFLNFNNVVKDKLKDGNFKTDDKVKDKLFYEVQDLQTYANQWLPDYSGNVIGGFNKLVGDIDEENFHQL